MIKFKTYMFSALALGTLASGYIPSQTLADHQDGRGRGYGKQVVDVYIDAGHQTRLEKIIGSYLVQNNPYMNIVYSPRYADVTVRVDGHTSRPEIYDRSRRGRGGEYATMNYKYKIRVTAGGKTIFKDKIRGEVSRPVGGRRDHGRRGENGGYHRGSGDKFEKAERAIEIFGVFIETITRNDITYSHNQGGGGGGSYGRGGSYNLDALERSLKKDAFEEIAAYVSRVNIPRRGYGKGYGKQNNRKRY